MSTSSPTISACILARNEECRLEPALQSLMGWTDQIILIDNESEDGTVALARRYTDDILTAPLATNFDAARNLAIEPATGDWIFYLDADERVPSRLGQTLRHLVAQQGGEFEALVIPFKHYFCGKWIQHCNWWPGYTRPQLLKKGCFRYNERLHSGIQVEGRTLFFPDDDPDLAIQHFSFENLHHYLDKLNRYTDGEAENLLADGADHGWQAQLAHFVHDWQLYYDRGRGDLDGMHGFVLSFLSATYRFVARAKLWDLRSRSLPVSDAAHEAVPSDVAEMLGFMERIAREGAGQWLGTSSPRQAQPRTAVAPVAVAPSSDLEPAFIPNAEQLRWEAIYEAVDLQETPKHFLAFTSMPFLARYLETVRSLCPPGGRVLETGVGFGYGAIWLSQRGIEAEGIDYSPALVQRANAINRLLGGTATFRFGDLFALDQSIDDSYDVIFHQGVLEHFSDEEIRTILQAQVARAGHVVFSVPSVHYPFEPEFGNERLLSLEQWQALLDGFDVERLVYYGDPALGGREHVLGVLRGESGREVAATPRPELTTAAFQVIDRRAPREPIAVMAPTARLSSSIPVPLLWNAPLLDPSGYADEARQFVLGLIEARESVLVAPLKWSDNEASLPPDVRQAIEARVVARDTPTELFVCHAPPTLQRPSPCAKINIARTMFETDRLPPGGSEALNAMDRVWVPSEFNRETFVRSGVDPNKIAVLPGAFDPTLFTAKGEPWPLPGEEAFRFLSVFDWTLHKGWDVLLTAFAAEFGTESRRSTESVGLVLKVWSSNGYTFEDIQHQADMLLKADTGRSLAEYPNIHLWEEMVPVDELPRIYQAVEAFVLPTRGEGWCRPLMEAMASGLPTIATAWSGLTVFHHARVGYPLPCTLAPVSAAGAREIRLYAGHCWAEPDVCALRDLMRQLVEDPMTGRGRGLAAKGTVAHQYSRAAVTSLLREELEHCRSLLTPGTARRRSAVPISQGERHRTAAVPARTGTPGSADDIEGREALSTQVLPSPAPRSVDFRTELGRALRVQWNGDQALFSSLALVNRQFCLGLLEAGDVEMSLKEWSNAWHDLSGQGDARLEGLFALLEKPLSGPADVTVRHHFPPSWQRPDTGKLIVIQPWEYGYLPRDWVLGAEQADEIWVYSRFIRDVYVRSGVPAEKIRVIPLGFDPTLFRSEGARFALPTRKSFRFLFVGGALERKGADLLLKAYLQAFSADDDVCLVVKDMGTQTFYQGQTLGHAFRNVQLGRWSGASGISGAPEVVYLDRNLTDPQLASLYRACSCVVLPYRGEGFALSPLEGMACGLPAIVTAGGPTEDYLDDTVAVRVSSLRRMTGGVHVGPFECVGDPWLLEPDLEGLVTALRWMRDHPEKRLEQARAAQVRAHSAWTWGHAVTKIRERLAEIILPLAEPRRRGATLWADGGREHAAEPPGKETPTERRPPPPPARTAPPSTMIARGSKTRSLELSLCLIARDEAPRIADCLKSIAPYVDEMVVVDTGSTDPTREIARDCGARVYDFPWTDSFAEARNQSLDQARGDWIFWMDADDVMEPGAAQQLRELVRCHPQRDVAYQIPVLIPPGPGEFSPTIVDHVKLFPNLPDLRFEHRIHEQILPSIRRAGLQVQCSDLRVIHENYDRSTEGQEKKRQRDFRLLDLDLRDHPDHPFVLFNLGMTYLHATREYEVAAQYLRRSLDRSAWQDSIVRKAYAMLTTTRICQKEWQAALAANEEGRRYYPDDAELLFQAGQVYQAVGRFVDARQALERLVAGNEQPHYRSVDTGLRSYRGRHELALLFRTLGSLDHCLRELRSLVATYPHYLPAHLDLVETLCLSGDRHQAWQLLAQIPYSPDLDKPLARLHQLVAEGHRPDSPHHPPAQAMPMVK